MLPSPAAVAGPPGEWTRITGAPVEAKSIDVVSTSVSLPPLLT